MADRPTLWRCPNRWSGSAGLGLLVAVCVVSTGCARSLAKVNAARGAFLAGDLVTARDSLLNISESRSQYAEVAALDLAMVELASGDTASATLRLRRLRDRFDQQPEIAPLHEAVSLVTDDTARLYRPAGYEEVMIRTMLAVCSIAGDGSDAESYALQATHRQNELAQEAEDRGVLDSAQIYQPIAVAPYIRGMLREATHHDYDDAAKAYQLVSSVQPQFAPAAADIARASGGTHSAPGHGVLYVIACVGRGPVLTETDAELTSTALSIASMALNAETNRGDRSNVDVVLPNLASVKVPQVVVPALEVAAVGVLVDGKLRGATQTLTDVGQLAIKQTAAEMPWTVARAVVRRTTKELTVAKFTDLVGLQGAAGSLFHFAAATSWSGLEHADTRCWGLLPREIQVFRLELPIGDHQIVASPMAPNGAIIAAGQHRTVTISAGQNEYLIAICPNHRLHLVQPN
jgi:hypothetical protein